MSSVIYFTEQTHGNMELILCKRWTIWLLNGAGGPVEVFQKKPTAQETQVMGDFEKSILQALPGPLWIPTTILNGPPWLNKVLLYFTLLFFFRSLENWLKIMWHRFWYYSYVNADQHLKYACEFKDCFNAVFLHLLSFVE